MKISKVNLEEIEREIIDIDILSYHFKRYSASAFKTQISRRRNLHQYYLGLSRKYCKIKDNSFTKHGNYLSVGKNVETVLEYSSYFMEKYRAEILRLTIIVMKHANSIKDDLK